jgi:hypothetical protein
MSRLSHFQMLLCLLVILAIPDTAFGAPRKSRFRGGKGHNVVREEGRTVIYKKRTEVEFDDSLIEGEVKNPNEFYFVHRPEEKFGSLVKKRRNFHKEMLRDTVMIR